MNVVRYHTKTKAIEEIENVEKLSLIDGKLALLTEEFRQLKLTRELLLQKVLKNYKLPKSQRVLLIPFDDIPYLKGTARTLICLNQEKALAYVLRKKDLKGMKLTATKEVASLLPKTYLNETLSKHSWRTI